MQPTTTATDLDVAELGAWEPHPDRADVGDLVAADEAGRIPELLPLRRERMSTSPFAFYRATASIFAHDLAHLPRTGHTVQLSGDAHLSNFGLYRAPDRTMVFDLNDFDETLPGPFEWDLRRLVTSVELAGRHRDIDAPARNAAAAEAVRSYVEAVVQFALMHHVELHYYRLTVKRIEKRWGDGTPGHMKKRLKETIRKAESKDRLKAFRKLTVLDADGNARFRDDLDNLTPAHLLGDQWDARQMLENFEAALASYRATLSGERQMLLDRYRFVDLARRVGGVGSVGTRCWVALLLGAHDDPLILQIKEAGPSVLEAYLGGTPYDEHGQRVVEGQKRMQASPDAFLGYEQLVDDDGLSHDYYFRQLWDGKGSFDLETITPEGLELCATISAHTLARAHARTSDADALAEYLGDGHHLTEAMTRFAVRYADQVEADFAAFTG